MKKTLTKILSFLMILLGIYHLSLSLVSIFYIYPQTIGSGRFIPFRLQESLVEKAIAIYLSTLVNGFYGVALFVKPSNQIKTIHLLAGMAIFVFSLFFVTQTSLTTDPLRQILNLILKSH